MLGGGGGASEGRFDGCDGGVGRKTEALLHAAVLDDEAGGHEGIQLGLAKIPHGLGFGEVGEEGGQEGDEAVERTPVHVSDHGRFSLLWKRRHGIFRVDSHGAGNENAGDDVGGGVQEPDAEVSVEDPPELLHLSVAALNLAKKIRSKLVSLLFWDDGLVSQCPRPIDLWLTDAHAAEAAADHTCGHGLDLGIRRNSVGREAGPLSPKFLSDSETYPVNPTGGVTDLIQIVLNTMLLSKNTIENILSKNTTENTKMK